MATAAILALVGALAPPHAQAHPLAPALLDIHVEATGATRVLLRTPAAAPPGAVLAPGLPARGGAPGAPPGRTDGSARVLEWQLACGPQRWTGALVGLRGLAVSGSNAIVRVQVSGRTRLEEVLHADHALTRVPAAASAGKTLRSYLSLGFVHILGGGDHLLFLLGLLLCVRGTRALIETASAFTLGHSLTLVASQLGWVAPPQGLMEIGIAASLVWLAVDVAAAREGPRRGWRHPRALAAGFGLLHGFGFSGALAGLGLPPDDIPLALGAFNVGIEIGQAAFLSAVLTAGRVVRGMAAPASARGRVALAYGIGSLGCLWILERSAAWLALG
ncbi:MAG: HupE/UreJ family protein [Myxococcota bacterium]